MNAQMTKQEFGSWGMRVTGLAIAYLVFVLVLPFFVAQSILWLTLIMFIAAGCLITLLLWGQNDLIYLICVQLEYTIFCAAAMGSLALVFFFVPMWTWQEALVFKAIVSGSVIAAVAALSMWRSFNKIYPPARPRDLVQFALKASAIVGSAGFLLIFAIVMLLPNEAPHPASQQYLVLFSLVGLSMVAMYNRRFGDNLTGGRRLAIKLTLLVVIVELVLAGYTMVWLAIGPKGTEIHWTQGITWVLAFLFTVVMLSGLGWFRDRPLTEQSNRKP